MLDNGATTAVRPDWSAVMQAIAQHQDRAAFARLFRHFAPRIKTFVRRSGATEADAENVAQEAMLKVWRKAALFNSATTGCEAWIFTIARNLRIDAMRRERRGALHGAGDIDQEFLLDEAPLPDAVAATAQHEVLIRRALTELSSDQRRVVEMSFYQERAHAEIAETLGIPLGTVKSRLRLAMVKLRGLLSDHS
jgi:RNA polymerase sigma-70 factor, ECF subfamily